MSPDPSHQFEERRVSTDNSYLSVVVNSDNDDDDISYEGYEILPQDLHENNFELEDEDHQSNTSEEEEATDVCMTSSNFDQSVKIELAELWSTSVGRGGTDIVMDSLKEEEIKNAMASFKLPSSSIPIWAKNIPEEQWKQQILNRINASNNT